MLINNGEFDHLKANMAKTLSNRVIEANMAEYYVFTNMIKYM